MNKYMPRHMTNIDANIEPTITPTFLFPLGPPCS
ncbi:hypothetical protein OIU76_019199 [Salix suchowensis]|nr:hypothetical protein OIU76_019199 [Salix suchowensis]